MKGLLCSDSAADQRNRGLSRFLSPRNSHIKIRFYPYFLRVCAPHALAGLLYTAAPQDVRVAPTPSHAAVLLGGCVDILALHI
jgi:hypothetical protein